MATKSAAKHYILPHDSISSVDCELFGVGNAITAFWYNNLDTFEPTGALLRDKESWLVSALKHFEARPYPTTDAEALIRETLYPEGVDLDGLDYAYNLYDLRVISQYVPIITPQPNWPHIK
ncbi:MAG: hypothetical protein ACRC8K_02215 [Waterburya sp.]